jgi:hypothetical protein
LFLDASNVAGFPDTVNASEERTAISIKSKTFLRIFPRLIYNKNLNRLK